MSVKSLIQRTDGIDRHWAVSPEFFYISRLIASADSGQLFAHI
jgi:hypothetical protein